MKIPAAHPQPDTVELRRQLIATCFLMRDRLGYFISTWGNISVRVEKGLLVTPSRANYEELKPEDLVVVNWEGERVKGERLPTSEIEMHRQLMLERPDFGALIHHHGQWSSVFACTGQTIPMVSDDMAMVVGGEVHCAPYAPAARHKQLAEGVRSAIGPDSCAVLMANHGVICGGHDLDEAVICCQFVEKAAMVAIQAIPLGGVKPLSEEAWREEREHYLFKYGKSADLEGVMKSKRA